MKDGDTKFPHPITNSSKHYEYLYLNGVSVFSYIFVKNDMYTVKNVQLYRIKHFFFYTCLKMILVDKGVITLYSLNIYIKNGHIHIVVNYIVKVQLRTSICLKSASDKK